MPTHDKILELLDEKPAAIAYQSAFSYVCSLAYCGGHGTDGLVPFSALPYVHGTRKTAAALVRHQLWAPDPLGWLLRNWGERQQTQATTESLKRARRAGALKGNCTRWHGPDCHCWKDAI